MLQLSCRPGGPHWFGEGDRCACGVVEKPVIMQRSAFTALQAERDAACRDSERWRGHHRHAGGVIARYQKAVRLYWDACRREQAVADGDLEGAAWAEAQHAAHAAREEAEDGLWQAAGLPPPWKD